MSNYAIRSGLGETSRTFRDTRTLLMRSTELGQCREQYTCQSGESLQGLGILEMLSHPRLWYQVSHDRSQLVRHVIVKSLSNLLLSKCWRT